MQNLMHVQMEATETAKRLRLLIMCLINIVKACFYNDACVRTPNTSMKLPHRLNKKHCLSRKNKQQMHKGEIIKNRIDAKHYPGKNV